MYIYNIIIVNLYSLHIIYMYILTLFFNLYKINMKIRIHVSFSYNSLTRLKKTSILPLIIPY